MVTAARPASVRGRHARQGDAPGAGVRRTRLVWVTSFLAFVLVGVVWSLVQPPFSAANEELRFVAAQQVWAGHWDPPVVDHIGALVPQLPAGVLHHTVEPSPTFGCYLGKWTVSADCAATPQMVHIATSTTSDLTREPPLPFLLDGLPIAVHPSLFTLDLGRLLDAAVGAAGLATCLAMAAARRRPLLFAGVVVAATPSVVAAFGTLDSYQLEIGAASVVWTCVALLLDGEAPTRRFVTLTVAATSVLVLSRPESLVYLALAGIAVLIGTDRGGLRRLVAAPAARIGAAVLAVPAVAAAAWAFLLEVRANPLFVTSGSVAPIHGFGGVADFVFSIVENQWLEAMGATGVNEYNGPWWVDLTWTFLIAVVVGLGLLFCTRRRRAVVVFLTVSLVAMPITVQVVSINSARFTVQGRFILPLLAGVVIVAASGLDGALAGFPPLRRVATSALSVAGILQVWEIVAVLRRFAVGVLGTYNPLHWPAGWQPLPSKVLLAAAVVVVGAAFALLRVWAGVLVGPAPPRPGPPGTGPVLVLDGP